jgi:transcriptional regulator with PAS, ATPase and Fis domain
LLLDEIGDMDLRLQAKLVHVLEDKECEHPGGK